MTQSPCDECTLAKKKKAKCNESSTDETKQFTPCEEYMKVFGFYWNRTCKVLKGDK